MKKSVRMMSIAIAIVLLTGFLFIGNLFFGNPISGLISKSKATNYINNKYPHLSLKISRVNYSFKDGKYYVRLQSDQSPDTHFSIGIANGNIAYDGYETQVASGMNTFDRLCDEYRERTQSVMLSKIQAISNISVIPHKEAKHNIALDAAFDKVEVTDVDYHVHIKGASLELDYFAVTLNEIYGTLIKNGYGFATLGITVDNQGNLIEIRGVTEKHIKSDNFKDILQKAILEQSCDGIFAFAKNSK